MTDIPAPVVTDRRRKTRLRLLAVALALLALAAVLTYGASRAVSRSGEAMPLQDIIARQQAQGALYAPLLYDRTFYYKQALYRSRDAGVAILGGKAARSLDGQAFSTPALNLAGLSSLSETAELAQSLFTEKPPQLVVLVPDDAWLEAGRDKENIIRSPAGVTPRIGDGWRLLRAAPVSAWPSMTSGDPRFIGAGALAYAQGYAPDGSYRYSTPPVGAREEETEAPAEAAPSEKQLQRLQSLLVFLKERNIPVIMLAPPQPRLAKTPSVYQNNIHQRLAETARAQEAAFVSPADTSGLDPCEFIAPDAAGPVAWRRILLQAALEHTELRRHLDLAAAGAALARHSGQTTLADSSAEAKAKACGGEEDARER